ncbi:helix-turn-helix transcriptional regulator [Cryptosporangium japonicum]|uniref:helix-turn-helix domain-containing protein n=1 Tax=Cryptosporangium japonicum TaxID=80872 RepID=UPI0031DAFAAD
MRRRRLGQELRSLREGAGLTVEAVAKELDWSPSKVSRIETTAIKVGTVDLRALLDVYGVTDPDRRGGMLELGRESRETAWWMRVNDRTPIRSFRDFVGFEAEARRIRTYEPTIVPGLLQTEDYARAILKAFERVFQSTDVDLDEALKLRQTRQEILTRAEEPVEYVAIVDEAALRRPAGGKKRAEVMRGQIDRLLELNNRTNITIRVLPFEHGLHPGMNGAFTVVDLPHKDDPNVVYLEVVNEGVLLNDAESVRFYGRVFDGVQQEALGRDFSERLLLDVRDSYGS